MKALQTPNRRPSHWGLVWLSHRILLATACMALLQAWNAGAQRSSRQYPPYMGPSPRSTGQLYPRFPDQIPTDNDESYADSIRRAQLKALREKALVEDTKKLLKLATELNDEISEPGAGPLSKEQLRKVSKIQKLAKNVEENMKGPTTLIQTGPPVYFPSPQYPDPRQRRIPQ